MYKQTEKYCEHCGNTFLGNKTRKYCSYNCSHTSRRKRTTHTCPVCNKIFERQNWNISAKYCSYKCKHKSQSSNIILIKCNNCNKEFKRKEHKINKHNFCSHFCQIEFNRGSNHYEYKEFLHDKNIKLALKQWAKFIKERDNYTCQKCGDDNKKILEAHHIICRSIDINKQFEYNNGITLCLSCHLKEHANDKRAYRIIKCKLDNYNKTKIYA